MIKVRIKKDPDSYIHSVEVSGHADYAKHAEDIICSAVSFLSQAILNGLIEILKADVDYTVNQDGYLSFSINNNEYKKETIKALLDTFELGIKTLEEGYGKHVKLVKEEV